MELGFDSLYKNLFKASIPTPSGRLGTYTPSPLLYLCPPKHALKLDISMNKAKDTITVKTNDGHRDFVSNNLSNIRHDFTFDIISGKTDVPLSTIKFMSNDTDFMTPDFIQSCNDGYQVVEFATNFSSTTKSLQNAYGVKHRKYLFALEMRSKPSENGSPIVFCILIVSHGCIFSNLNLHDEIDLMEHLTTRYQATAEIESFLEHEGIAVTRQEDTMKQARVIKSFKEITESSISFNENKAFNHQLWENRFGINYGPDFINDLRDKISECNVSVAKEKLCRPLSIDERLVDEENKWTAMWKEQGLDVRSYPKSIIQLPQVVVKTDASWKDANILPNMLVGFKENGSTTSRLISTMFSSVEETSFTYQENVEFELSVALGKSEPPPKSERSKFRKVSVRLDNATKTELAKVGLCGKKHKHDYEVQLYKSDHHKDFSVNTYVDDIDDYLATLHFYDSLEPDVDSRVNMLKIAMNMHSRSTEWIRYEKIIPTIDFIISFKYFKAMKLISQIASELACTLKQHTKEGQFILKRLRNLPVFLLIKASHGNGPECFSIIMKKEYVEDISVGHVFRKLQDGGDWLFTDLVTTNESKLVNWIKAETMFFSLFAYASEYWKLDLPLSREQPNFVKACCLTNLLMMIFLHDKKKTEEVFTTFRYISLEGYKHLPEQAMCQDLYVKLNNHPKNRLMVWAMHKIRFESRRIISMDGYNQDYKTFKLNCFRCPYTGLTLLTPEQQVSTFYFGYLCNKEEAIEVNAISTLINKIIEQEDRFPSINGVHDYKHLGHEEPDNLNDLKLHEFSVNFLVHICNHSKKKLKKLHGNDYMKVLEDRIINNLSNDFLLELATLKASSQFKPGMYFHDYESYSRTKAAIGIFCEIDENDFIVTDLIKKCLDYFSTNDKSMHMCLFRKAQHGGTREIYVLEIKARIIQKIVESISKTICRYFQSEIMTHPENKYRIPEMHRREIKHTCAPAEQIVSFAASDDAEKWSQRHHVSKFFILLCQFTPTWMHPFLFRALQIWETKRMMIDVQLLNLFNEFSLKGLEIKSEDPIVKRLYNAYTGKTFEKWMPSGVQSTYIEIESGMCQGILHFLSSLLHSVYLEWFEDTMLASIKINLEHRKIQAKPYAFHLQSSDDSSIVFSYVCRNMTNKNATFFAYQSSIIFRLKGVFSRWIGIYSSPLKAKLNTVNFMEFNSEFYIGGSVYKPTIKFITSSQHIVETEKLVGRQEEMYNLITQIPENGGSFILASLCQFAQGMLHYNLLGYYLSPLFSRYIQSIEISRDPSAGFFLLDDPVAAGIGGLAYLLYVAMKFSPNLRAKYKLMLQAFQPEEGASEIENQRRKDALETMSSGLCIKGTAVPLCNTDKWKKAVDKMISQFEYDWELEIESRPFLLYRKPMNGVETKLGILAKMHTPGVPQSMSKMNAATKVMALGSYLLARPVVHAIEKLDFNFTGYETQHTQQSLLSWASYQPRAADLNEQEISLLFPYWQDYEELTSKMESFEELKGSFMSYKGQGRRKIKSSIVVYSNDEDYYVNPERIVCDKWFQTKTSHLSTTAVDYHFAEMQKTFKWLHECVDTTLQQSPFQTHIKMKNFFSSLIPKRRSIRLNGTPATVRGGVSNIISAVCMDIWGDLYFTGKEDIIAKNKSILFQQAQQSLYLYCAYPNENCPDTDNEKLIKLIKTTVPDDLEVSSRSDRAKIKIIAAVARKKDKHDIVKMLLNLKLGVLGYWLKPQSKIKGTYRGPGTWLGQMNGINVLLQLGGTHESLLVSVSVNKHLNQEDIVALNNGIEEWCLHENVDYTWKNSRPSYDEIDDDFIDKPRSRILYFLASKGAIRTTHSGSKYSAPAVIYDPMFSSRMKEVFIESFHIETWNHIIRVKVKMVNDDRIYSVLRYVTKHSHMQCGVNETLIKSLEWEDSAMKPWLLSEELPPDTAADFVLDTIKKHSYSSENPHPKFLRLLLTHHFMESGMLLRKEFPTKTKDFTSLGVDVKDEPEVDIEMINSMALDFSEMLGLDQEHEVFGTIEEERCETTEDIITFNEEEDTFLYVQNMDSVLFEGNELLMAWRSQPLLKGLVKEMIRYHYYQIDYLFKYMRMMSVHI